MTGHRLRHNNDEDQKKKEIGEVPDVQLAPVTKEVFVTVLDSLKGPSSDENKAGSKQHFIRYVHGMADKIKDFPKLFKVAHKRSKELKITPALCESISELLALPDPDRRAKYTEDDTDRLCTEDEISRASKDVSSILLTPGAFSSQHDVNETLKPHSSSPSLASVRSEHEDACGIVDTIVTDLEDLYESLEPKEVEMLQSQSLLTQIEPTVNNDATQKKFHNKVYSILCSTQVKLRMFFTIHRSQDIMPSSKTNLPTEDTCHDIQPEDGREWPNQSDAEGQPDVLLEEHEELVLSSADEQAIVECAVMDMPDSKTINIRSLSCEKDEGVPPPAGQHEAKDKKRGMGKGLKIFFVEHRVLRHKAKSQEAASSLEESTVDNSAETVSCISESELESMSTSSIAAPQETTVVEVAQHYVASSQAPPQCVDICEENETTLTSLSKDQGNDVSVITESSDRQDNHLSLGKKLKNVLVRFPLYSALTADSLETVSFTEEDKACEPLEQSISISSQTAPQGEEFSLISDRTDIEQTCEYGDLDNIIVDTTTESSICPEFTQDPPGLTSPPTDNMAKEVILNGNQPTMGRKFKRLFSKSSSSARTPVTLEPTQDNVSSSEEIAIETCAPEAESYPYTAALQPSLGTLPETSPSDDICEGGGTSLTAMKQDKEPDPTKTTPDSKDTHLSLGKRLKTLFWSSKPLDVGLAVQADEAVPEVALTVPSDIAETTSECAELSHAVLDTIAETSQSPESLSQEMIQASPILETVTCVTVVDDGMTAGNSRSMGNTLKQFFVKYPKNKSDVPAVPIVSQEAVEESADDISTPKDVSWASEAAVQQSDHISSQESPRREDIFEIDGTVSPISHERGPSSDLTSQTTKADHLSIGEKLKQFFFRPKHPEGSLVDTQGFPSISEATLALKDVTDRMLLNLDDASTSTARLEHLISRGVLRPFTDDLVNQVYSFLNAIGSSASCIEPSRFASESGIPKTKTSGRHRRELVLDCRSEMTRAFTERSVNIVIRQLLEMLLPLSKDADTSGSHVLDVVTDIMAKEVVNTISLDHLTLQKTDSEVSNHFSLHIGLLFFL